MRKASEIFGDCVIEDLPKNGIDFLINTLDINEKGRYEVFCRLV